MFTPAAAEADRRALLDAYAKKGYYSATVTPNIIRLPDNRVNVVFQCTEGPQSLIGRITFIGNHHFSQSRLREVVSSRQSAWYRFLLDLRPVRSGARRIRRVFAAPVLPA